MFADMFQMVVDVSVSKRSATSEFGDIFDAKLDPKKRANLVKGSNRDMTSQRELSQKSEEKNLSSSKKENASLLHKSKAREGSLKDSNLKDGNLEKSRAVAESNGNNRGPIHANNKPIDNVSDIEIPEAFEESEEDSAI
jgi:hypothetical protein